MAIAYTQHHVMPHCHDDNRPIRFPPAHVRSRGGEGTHVGVVNVHGKCLSREQHAIRNVEEWHGGRGVLFLHSRPPFLVQVTQILHNNNKQPVSITAPPAVLSPHQMTSRERKIVRAFPFYPFRSSSRFVRCSQNCERS